MFDTNWGTDLVLEYDTPTHSIFFHSHTTQNSILGYILVNMVHTSMFFMYFVHTHTYQLNCNLNIMYFFCGRRQYSYVWVPP
jgi:hypothetical protein